MGTSAPRRAAVTKAAVRRGAAADAAGPGAGPAPPPGSALRPGRPRPAPHTCIRCTQSSLKGCSRLASWIFLMTSTLFGDLFHVRRWLAGSWMCLEGQRAGRRSTGSRCPAEPQPPGTWWPQGTLRRHSCQRHPHTCCRTCPSLGPSSPPRGHQASRKHRNQPTAGPAPGDPGTGDCLPRRHRRGNDSAAPQVSGLKTGPCKSQWPMWAQGHGPGDRHGGHVSPQDAQSRGALT